MNAAASVLHALILQHHEALLSEWRRRIGGEQGADLSEWRTDMAELLRALDGAIEHTGGPGAPDALQRLDEALAATSRLRAARGHGPEDSVRFVHAARDGLLSLLAAHPPADAALGDAARQLVQGLIDRCVTTLVSQFVAAREGVIRSQAQSLLDMSTPVITLWDSILLLPLVGIVDSVRAVQVAERLLEAIGRTEAEVTLIDVTGVPVMDTSVARHLLRTVAAAEMLGTRVVLTGISPTTAQTMVKLGIDMSSVPTRGSLKAGVALALTMTRRAIRDVQEA